MKFRLLTGIVLIAVVIWSGIWFFAQHQTKNVLNSWMNERREEGWTVPQNGFSVTGYPNRIDVTAEPWQLDDPEAAWAWQAPFLKLYTLVYNPSHIIAHFAPEQTIFYTDTQDMLHQLDMTSKTLEASIIFDKITLPEPTITQMDIVGDGLSLLHETALFSIGDLGAHLRQTPDANDTVYDFAAKLTRLELPESFWKEIDPNGRLGTLDQAFDARMQVTFEAPLNTRLFDGVAPTITQMDVSKLKLKLGVLHINGQGALELAPEGWPVGDLDLIIRGWKEALAVAEESGLLSENNVAVASMALQFLSGGGQDTLKAPLSFKRGRIFLGPIPIGRAPILSRAAAPTKAQ